MNKYFFFMSLISGQFDILEKNYAFEVGNVSIRVIKRDVKSNMFYIIWVINVGDKRNRLIVFLYQKRLLFVQLHETRQNSKTTFCQFPCYFLRFFNFHPKTMKKINNLNLHFWDVKYNLHKKCLSKYNPHRSFVKMKKFF